MSGYKEKIQKITQCSDTDAAMVERLMRQSVAPATLRRLSEKEFAGEARDAMGILDDYRPMFELRPEKMKGVVFMTWKSGISN